MSHHAPTVRLVLTDLASRMLAFEKRRWNHQGARIQSIHDEFGMSPQQYLLRLNALLDNPDALAAEPQLVNRLRRLREERRRARSA